MEQTLCQLEIPEAQFLAGHLLIYYSSFIQLEDPSKDRSGGGNVQTKLVAYVVQLDDVGCVLDAEIRTQEAERGVFRPLTAQFVPVAAVHNAGRAPDHLVHIGFHNIRVQRVGPGIELAVLGSDGAQCIAHFV